jgi:16S rRNA (guanine527-N7)-methyltransferase
MKEDAGSRLNVLLDQAGLPALDSETSARFANYLALILRWNRRINLTSIHDEDGILRRHFVESIACARALPAGISTLLDFGSGAGLPGIPIAICHPETTVTLAESQGKKAAFLQEAARVLGIAAKIYSGRAETLEEHFDCVVLRAVDRMKEAVRCAGGLVTQGGWLALMTTVAESRGLKSVVGEAFGWTAEISLPGSDERVLALGKRQDELATGSGDA